MIKSFIKLPKNVYSFSQLYTWGSIGLGTGFNKEEFNYKPQKLSQFDNKVEKVSMGYQHSAVVTKDGDLYCFGKGIYGQLGNNDFSDSFEPQLVEFFAQQKLKVKDVACGKYQTLALTTDGQLWSFGYGGNQWTMQMGGLGCGKLGRQSTPQKVEINQQIHQIASGEQWSTVLTQNKDVYNFGKGGNGNFGDPYAKDILLPTLNENFSYFKEQYNLEVVKILGCSNFSVALLSDGHLYSMGCNMEGQCGVREVAGQIVDRELLRPTEVVFEKKVKDFEIGQNSMVILTDNNEVYFSGLEMAYKPVKFDLPQGVKVKSISCCRNSIFVLSGFYFKFKDDNIIYSNTEEQLDGMTFNFNIDAFVYDGFKGKNVKKIGGNYNSCYAILE